MTANSGKKSQSKPTWEQIQKDRDERVALPLDEDDALRGLLKVDPEAEPAPADRAGEARDKQR